MMQVDRMTSSQCLLSERKEVEEQRKNSVIKKHPDPDDDYSLLLMLLLQPSFSSTAGLLSPIIAFAVLLHPFLQFVTLHRPANQSMHPLSLTNAPLKLLMCIPYRTEKGGEEAERLAAKIAAILFLSLVFFVAAAFPSSHVYRCFSSLQRENIIMSRRKLRD
jgi:hypothetical protein